MIKILILLLIIFFLILLLLSKVSKLKIIKRIPTHYLILNFFFVTLFFLLAMRILNNIDSNGTYVPAKYDGKVLVPGKVEFEKK